MEADEGGGDDLLDPACTLAYRVRIEGDLTVAELAQACGLSVSSIRRYESGETVPSRVRLLQMAEAAGVSLAKLEAELEWQDAAPDPVREKRERLFRELDSPPAPPRRSSLLGGFGPSLDVDAILANASLAAARKGTARSYDRPSEAPAVEVRPWLLLKKAAIHHVMGNDEAAAEELSLASLMIDIGSPGPLFVYHLLRSAFLVAAGESEGAFNLLPSLESAAQRIPPPGEELRVRWVRARISGARGNRATARGALADLQAELTTMELALETTCVWIDRVALALAEGPAAVPPLRNLEPTWARQDRAFDRHMVTALELFGTLLEDGRATPQVAHRLVAYLLVANLDPGIPFEPSPQELGIFYPPLEG